MTLISFIKNDRLIIISSIKLGKGKNVLIATVIILIIVVLGLSIYNFRIHKKIETYKNVNQKINNLSVVQDFMSAIGETITVDDKIKKINNILIEKYEIKYSTIVVFNGAEYQVKASNVEERHWNALKKLHEVEMFKDSKIGRASCRERVFGLV